MMTLDGWDTVTICDVALVNQSMVARQNEFLTSFEYRQGRLNFKGTFGPWQIRHGGSVQTLSVEIPITSGKLKGIPGRIRALQIAGLTLVVKLKLRLLPSTGDVDSNDLVFDLDADETVGSDDPVLPIEVIDPSGKLSDMERQLLAIVAAECLSANANKVTYVFASVKTRGTTDIAELVTPYHDWCNIVTPEERQYMALFGAIAKPKGRVEGIDPALIAQVGSAYLALSNNIFHVRVLEPTLSDTFRPRTKFKANANSVWNAHRIPLPPQDVIGFKMHPYIDTLKMNLSKGGLKCCVKARGELPFSITFRISVDMFMPLKFDPKTGKMKFLPDPKPVVKHSAHLPEPFDTLIGWLVRFFVSFFEKPITSLIKEIAKKMQSFNTPTVETSAWSGLRDFKTGAVQADGCFWFCDTRPVALDGVLSEILHDSRR